MVLMPNRRKRKSLDFINLFSLFCFTERVRVSFFQLVCSERRLEGEEEMFKVL